jgi:hypothetical protein
MKFTLISLAALIALTSAAPRWWNNNNQAQAWYNGQGQGGNQGQGWNPQPQKYQAKVNYAQPTRSLKQSGNGHHHKSHGKHHGKHHSKHHGSGY